MFQASSTRSPTELANTVSIALLRLRATCRNVRFSGSRRLRQRPARLGQILGCVPRACCRDRNQSRPSPCCPIIRPLPSPGDGIRRRVKRADGPERVFGERWKQDAEPSALRDYFRVEDEAGERFWIYRASDGEDTITGSHRWFLHGIFG